jgi:UDP-N-acetylmuramate dehydrogenase
MRVGILAPLDVADRELMADLNEFSEILTPNVPLAPMTGLGVGGNADWLARPRDADELQKLIVHCNSEKLPWRILGGGANVLAPDDGVRGVVIVLDAPSFKEMSIIDQRIRCGAGALLADLVAFACSSSMTGMECLAGIPGTVGGALRGNAGTRQGDIGQLTHAVEVLEANGKAVRLRNELRFGYRESNLDDVVILAAVFELAPDKTEDVVRRLKKFWIAKKAQQPFGFQKSGCAFRNPRGLLAAELVDKAGMKSAKVGGAEICDRDPCYVIAHHGCTSRDVHRLLELVMAKVAEKSGVHLDLQLDVW